MSFDVGTMYARLDLDNKSFIIGMAQATGAVTTFQKLTHTSSGLLGNLAVAFSSVGIGEFVATTIKAGEEITNLNRRLEVFARSITATTGATASAGEQFKYLRDTALRTGQSFDTLSKTYAGLAPTALSVGVKLETVRNIMEGTVGAAAMVGASTEEVGRAFVAIRQIIGKNALQMEELRGQLGEALPNSMLIMTNGLTKIAANSEAVRSKLGLLGSSGTVSLSMLHRLVQEGVIDAQLFAQAWEAGTESYRTFSQMTTSTVSGQMQNLATLFKTNIGSMMSDGGFNAALSEGLKIFNDWFDKVTKLTTEESKKIRDEFIRTMASLSLIIVNSWNEISSIAHDVVGGVIGVMQSALKFYNDLPEGIREWGIIGLLLGGAKIRAIIGLFAAMGEGVGIAKTMAAYVGGDGAKVAELVNKSGLAKLFDVPATTYSKNFGEKFANEAVLGKSSDSSASLTNSDRIGMVDKERALTEGRLTAARTELAAAQELAKSLADSTSQRSEYAAKQLFAAEQRVKDENSKIDLLVGLKTVLESGEGQGQGISIPKYNAKAGQSAWSIGDPREFTERLIASANAADDKIRNQLANSKSIISDGKTGTSMDTWHQGERDRFATYISNIEGDLGDVLLSGTEAVRNIKNKAQKVLGEIYQMNADGSYVYEADGKTRKTTKWGQAISEAQGDPMQLARIGGLSLKDIENRELLKQVGELGKINITGTPAQRDALIAAAKDFGRELKTQLKDVVVKDARGNVININDRVDSSLQAVDDKASAEHQNRASRAEAAARKARAAQLKAMTNEAKDYLYSGQFGADSLKAYADYSFDPNSGSPEDEIMKRRAEAANTKRRADLFRQNLDVNNKDLNPYDPRWTQEERLKNALIGEGVTLRSKLAEEAAKIKLIESDGHYEQALRVENSALSLQLATIREKIALLKDPASQKLTDELAIQSMNLSSQNALAQARSGRSADGAKAQFGSDAAQEELSYSKTLYEYNLSMEERLQLSRTQGIRSWIDEFSSGISSIMTGQEKVGAGFAKMVANMSKMLADMFAKWAVQQAFLFGMSSLGFDMGGATSPAVATSVGPVNPANMLVGHAHTGGIIGLTSLMKKPVNMSVFSGAPRFHTGGLVSGEVPIIAKNGEAIFTPKQMDNADRLIHSAMNNSSSAPINQTVNISVNGSAGTQSQNEDLAGRIGQQVTDQVRVLVNQEMRAQMRPGGMLNGGY